jgi:hypothetical protein
MGILSDFESINRRRFIGSTIFLTHHGIHHRAPFLSGVAHCMFRVPSDSIPFPRDSVQKN